MKRSLRPKLAYSAFALSTLAACGGSSSSEVDLADGLASLPSMSSMLAANGEVSSSSYLRAQAVTGTAPLLKDLSAENVDTYFFDGALVNLESWAADANSLTAGQKLTTVANYRGAEGAAGGSGACRMAQETGSVFDRMLQNGTSACYMKKMPGATGAAADTFSQTSADKLVRVHVSNMDHGGGDESSEMYVNIKVHGSASVGASVYKASLYFCEGTSGAPRAEQGYEEFELNKTTGVFSASSKGSQYNSEATAYLKMVGGSVAIDVSKDRSASYSFSGDGQIYKAAVTLTGNNKVYNKSYNNGTWGTSRNYSVASFTGGSMDNLRFTAGAFKGRGESEGCTYWNGSATVACDPWTYEGGTEFQDTHYVSTTSSSLYTELAEVDLTSDDFYADPTVEAADLSAIDCGATPDATIEMDFSTDAVKEAAAECEGDRLFDNEDSWRMCEGGRENEMLIWQYHQEH